jgi:hypothetical protein
MGEASLRKSRLIKFYLEIDHDDDDDDDDDESSECHLSHLINEHLYFSFYLHGLGPLVRAHSELIYSQI